MLEFRHGSVQTAQRLYGPPDLPPDLLKKRTELSASIEADTVAIRGHLGAAAKQQEEQSRKKQTLAALDLTLRQLYGWQGSGTTPPIDPAPSPPMIQDRTKLTKEQYWEIIEPALRKQSLSPDAMRHLVLQHAHVEISMGAMSKMAVRTSEDSKYPMRKDRQGVYVYAESKLMPRPPASAPSA